MEAAAVLKKTDLGLKSPPSIVVILFATDRELGMPGRAVATSDLSSWEAVTVPTWCHPQNWPHDGVGMSSALIDLIVTGFTATGVDVYDESGLTRVVEISFSRPSSEGETPKKLTPPMYGMLLEGVFDNLVVTSMIKNGVRIDTIEAVERSEPGRPVQVLRIQPDAPDLYRLDPSTPRPLLKDHVNSSL